jgi:hypothetical protein
MLIVAKKQITMIRRAFQHPRQARTAHALFARKWHINAIFNQYFQNTFIGR